MEVFATITSLVFSELALVIVDDAMLHLPHEVTLFETLREMNALRPFKLVFLLNVPDISRREARRKLAEALDSVAEMSLLDFLDSPPTIR
jgi:hypothetical protein